MGMYRAVLISGPPGIGKTTSAHITAKLAGYSPIELNASDTRSKKLIEVGLAVFVWRHNVSHCIARIARIGITRDPGNPFLAGVRVRYD
jgi:DNA polymerase III delta prime subunit